MIKLITTRMPDDLHEGTLTSEAKVLAEEAPKIEENITANVAHEDQPPAKKKKNPIVVLLMVLIGLAAVCCSCAVGGFIALNYTIQNSGQAVAVKELFSALNVGDQTKVKTLSSQTLYTDLYSPMDDGTTLADLIKNNIDEVNVTSFNMNNNNATVKFSLKVKRNPEIFDKVTYAELTKVGESWLVTYFGPEEATPETTIEDSN